MDTRKPLCTCYRCVQERKRNSKNPAPAWFEVTAVASFLFLGIANLW